MKKLIFLTMLLGLMVVVPGIISAQPGIEVKTGCRYQSTGARAFVLNFIRRQDLIKGRIGKCAHFELGDYPTIGEIDNQTMRIDLSSGVKLLVCRDINFGGGCEVIDAGHDITNFGSIGANEISSIKVVSSSVSNAELLGQPAVPSTNRKPPASDPMDKRAW